jgi:hypothetical protein
MATAKADDFTAGMFDAINGMMLDVLAAVARKDYDDRRRRQAQGQAKAEGSRQEGERLPQCRNRLDAEWRCLSVISGATMLASGRGRTPNATIVSDWCPFSSEVGHQVPGVPGFKHLGVSVRRVQAWRCFDCPVEPWYPGTL